ncbi:formyltetrahydrofolate deformylase [Raphidocelis subcapitata]|uniref:Formyltetrahydrofolate deformylase n=1 Tax=Raphidocelis subcapitata TaxID=307507 RepID=A0A2V0NK49_9CHLO|nr:formyltetrahydrofolate deformylase [Raphidocelis subcapitata]|eukprot:GBF87654.1 formyltetrahydrofolate deformylase [Raphidocelis subcapitata]
MSSCAPGGCSSSEPRVQASSFQDRRLPPTRAAAPSLPVAGAAAAAAAPAAAARGAGDDRRRTDLTGVLAVQCPDQKGVVASLAQLLFGFNCNILQVRRAAAAGSSGGRPYRPQPKRMGILVSKLDHCLWDLLIRHHSGELRCDIPVVISNHSDLKHVASMFGVDFVHVPIDEGKHESRAEAKAAQEAAIQHTLGEAGCDLIVLARYMQIFGEDFCGRNWRRTINIHHSFLPAFEGGRPYHRAHDRGVKIIGATAHYATSELDAGPIIEQDITRITHRDAPADMVRKGKDLERLVLARAVRWHLQDRVLVHANKTVVFED